MSEQQRPTEWKPGETHTSEDPYGKTYAAACPQCGRQVSARKPGEARCGCGAAVELRG